jgi:hypothetical protein
MRTTKRLCLTKQANFVEVVESKHSYTERPNLSDATRRGDCNLDGPTQFAVGWSALDRRRVFTQDL